MRTSAAHRQQLAFGLVRGHAKVDQLDRDFAVLVAPHHDILQLDVAMADPEASEVRDLSRGRCER